MGYAARQNPNSKWNKDSNKKILKVTTPSNGEPMVIEVNPKNTLDLAKDFLCRTASLLKNTVKDIQSLNLTS